MKTGRNISWQFIGVWAALALLLVVAGLLSDRFFTSANLFNVLRQCSMIAIIAVGMTFVIVSGGIDLSVGSIALLAGVFLAAALQKGLGIGTAVLATLAVGVAAGAVNGAGVAWFRIPPFVMTLAGMTIYRGLAYIYTDGQQIPIGDAAKESLLPIAGGYLFGTVPLPVVYMAVFFLAGYLVLNHARLGVHVFAIGGNEEAARLSGVNVGFTKLAVYVISGLCSAAAAVILTSRAGVGEILAGTGYELDAIAAVVIGGTSLAGGKGTVWGTLAGVLLLFVLINVFTMLNVHSYYQEVFKGVIIIIAVLIQYKRK